MGNGTTIIKENDDSSMIVIDIPASIANAQLKKGEERPTLRKLYSCPAVSKPYPSTEPKSAEAQRRVSRQSTDSVHARSVVKLVKDALQWTRGSTSVDQRFCHERAISRLSESGPKKRTADDMLLSEDLHQDDNLHKLASSPSIFRISQQAEDRLELHETKKSSSSDNSGFTMTLEDSFGGFWRNESNYAGSMSVMPSDDLCKRAEVRYHIPPKCSFLLGGCHDSSYFRSVAKSVTPAGTGRFDIILLDPPWPNRSAKRKSAYNTHVDLRTIRSMLVNMELDDHLLPNGIVAIWVTNRPSFRNLVLGPGGLFEIWNVTLVEEWIWIKITSEGEPVTPLDGVWRKPYEILLIGKAPTHRMTVASRGREVKRRVILAVPDLHSRKPCLRELFERILIKRSEDYSALEIFARYLVAGWFSWGNEVLKYNRDDFWAGESAVDSN